jgi:cellulose synthase/poly-beta-1,6-N-acetylglucosamine synthase-like glycosyltransferase
LILALDSDQVAKPDIIKRMIGYFRIPRIAFVQARQQFKLPEKDPWGNADKVFYEAIQSGKDYDNSAISCGSGVLYRREALQDVGGFSTWNLVEDLHTSFRLHEKGWRSVYYDSPLTVGTAPEEVVARRGTGRGRSTRCASLLGLPAGHRALKMAQRLQYSTSGTTHHRRHLPPDHHLHRPQWALFSCKPC